MQQSTTQNNIKFGILFVATLIGFGVFYGYLASPKERNDSSTDKLSGEIVNETQVRDASDVNPHLAIFIGLDALTENGISDDDIDYIKDFIEVYLLNTKNSKSARVSYVDKSFKYVNMGSNPDLNFEFKFGINGGDIHTATVRSSIIDEKISIELKDSRSKKVASKTFTIYPLNY